MSQGPPVPPSTPEPGAPTRAHPGVPARYRWGVYLGCTLLVLVTNYLFGKDMPWDTLNYHLYAGFSALHDRFANDYFAAGTLSYLNPYAFVPFYLLVSSGLSALAVSSILAAVNSTLLWLTFELALTAAPSTATLRARLTFALCAVALAALNPILIQEFGSSMSDISTAIPVLGGWLLLARAVREPRITWIICAGLLLGAATALKLTNSVHAIAALALLLVLPWNLAALLRRGFACGLAIGVGFAAVALPWSLRLAHAFGNPFFPMLNGVFRAPDFTTETLRLYRFIPESLGDALWRPFALLAPVRLVHSELRSPEICYAVLVILLLILVLQQLWRRLHPDHEGATRQVDDDSEKRVLIGLGLALALDWVLWLSSSANGRYFLPIASVAAVLTVALVWRMFRAKACAYILVGIFAVQIFQLAMATEFRWKPVAWGGPWFQVDVPRKLATEPNLYLTIGTQSSSFLIPYFDHDSGFTNFAGGYVLAPEGATGAHIRALITRYQPHVRVLIRGERVYEDSEGRHPRRSQVDSALLGFNLRVDTDDCTTIAVRGMPPDFEFSLAVSGPEAYLAPGDTTYFASCRLVPDDTDHSAVLARKRAVDLVLDRVEDACPELFQPSRPASALVGHGAWMRRYQNTDLNAWVSQGWVKFQNVITGGELAYLGSEADWTRAPLKVVCGRRNGRYYAHVIGAPERPQ
jgi:hypothetical protein